MTFAVALPDALALKVSPLDASASDTVSADIVVMLSRTVGKVTENTVEFSVVSDATGAAFGTFSDVHRSNADELATAQFIPGSNAPLGPATIRVRVPGRPSVAR